MKSLALRKLMSSLLLITSSLLGQNYLNGPECVVFDSVHNRYLVSNWTDGVIVSVDSAGVQTVFNSEYTHALGNTIIGNTFYFSTGSEIRGLNLETAELVQTISIPGDTQVDGMAGDNNGNLYAVASLSRRIVKVRLSDLAVWDFVDVGIPTMPQDIIFDEPNNRLLVVSYSSFSPIQAISLEDSVLTDLVITPMGFFDGIAYDVNGNYYVSCWGDSTVYMYNSEFLNPPLPLPYTFNGNSNICMNRRDNLLVVAEFNANTLTLVEPPSSYLAANFTASPVTGHAPLSVQFADASYALPEVTTRAWDFNADGTVDSDSAMATWIYSEPGLYTIQYEITNAETTSVCTLEQGIEVFSEGRSALQLDGMSQHIQTTGVSTTNLAEAFTLEAWINPESWGPDNIFGGGIIGKGSMGFSISAAGGSSVQHCLLLKLRHTNLQWSYLQSEPNSVYLDNLTHVAVTYDGATSSVSMYVNGQALEVLPIIPLNGELLDNEDIPFSIGMIGDMFRFNGLIDEVCVWNRVLDPMEIADRLIVPLTGNESGVLACWKMDEGNGDTLFDASPGLHHASMTGAQWVQGPELLPTNIDADRLQPQQLPHIPQLGAAYPNPFNSSTTFQYGLPAEANISLMIYNVRGQLVQTIESGINQLVGMRWFGMARLSKARRSVLESTSRD